MPCGRVLDACIFCGSDEMTEEHIIADWAVRAFLRSKKREAGFNGTFVGGDQMRMQAGEAIVTSKVVCRPCNNEWLSEIDAAAARVLKPLIRGKDAVTLSPEAQQEVATWMFKCALMFDAEQEGDGGRFAPLRADFAKQRTAPPACVVYAGPAPWTPFSVPGIPEVAGLALFGVRTVAGRLNLTINTKNPDGTVTPGSPSVLPIPGWLVMLGSLQATISGRHVPLVPAEEGFERIWPVQDRSVAVRPTPPPTAAAA